MPPLKTTICGAMTLVTPYCSRKHLGEERDYGTSSVPAGLHQGGVPILPRRDPGSCGQADVLSPRGLLPGSKVSEHRLNVVVEPGGVRPPDGSEFSNDGVSLRSLFHRRPP